MSDDRKEVRLQYPIMINKVKTDILKLRRMKVKDLKNFPDSLWELIENKKSKMNMKVVKDLVPVIAGLADITVEEADEIDITDLMSIAEVMSDILGN